MNRSERRKAAKATVGRGEANGHVTREARRMFAGALKKAVAQELRGEEPVAEVEVGDGTSRRSDGLYVVRSPVV
jgi:hypothetical protein